MKYQIADIKPHRTSTGKDMWFLKLAHDGNVTDCSTMDDKITKYGVGGEIDGDIVPNGKYMNFHFPKEKGALALKVNELEKRIEALEKSSPVPVDEDVLNDIFQR